MSLSDPTGISPLVRTVAVDLGGRVFAAGQNTAWLFVVTGRNQVHPVFALDSPAGIRGLTADIAHPRFAATTAHTIVALDATGGSTLYAGQPNVTGFADGPGDAARFRGPTGLALAPDGTLYVADTGNHMIRRIDPSGVVSTWSGQSGMPGSDDGLRTNARFRYPSGLALAPDGSLFVADTGNHTIRRITADGSVHTWAGQAGIAGASDGNGAHARFCLPEGIACDPDGGIIVADTGNHTLRAITAAGTVTTFAGQSGIGGRIDGSGREARFVAPYAVAISSVGLWVADTGNHCLRLGVPRSAISDAYFAFVANYDLDPASLGAPDADPDHDGMPNLLEFALGGAPNLPDAWRLPTVSIATTRNGARTLNYTFAGVPLRSDVSMAIDYSTDLKEWHHAAPGEHDVQGDNSSSTDTTVTVMLPVNIGRVFLRLRLNHQGARH